MKVGLGHLKGLLLDNVAEIRFQRRRPGSRDYTYRRMLCTNSADLLTSQNGRITLNYRPATKMPKYNPDAKNLLVTWDIIMQDYRNVNMDNCELLQTIPANDEFWEWFNLNIYPLTTMQKESYLHS